jgi:hypothetical protein
MNKRSKRSRDPAQLAKLLVDIAIGEVIESDEGKPGSGGAWPPRRPSRVVERVPNRLNARIGLRVHRLIDCTK